MVKVIRKQNKEVFERLGNAIKQLDNLDLKVGWFESSKYPDGTPVAYVASIQEFGSPQRSIPPRPYFRPTIVREKPAWRKLMESGSKAILAGNETSNSVMTKMGFKVSSDTARSIESVTTPPLSPITLALRKMRREDPGLKVGGKLIGQIAAQLARGEIDISGVNADPLKDSGYLLATLTFGVGKK